MIKVKIPATSANVGAGFDSLGLAVTLYNELHIDEYDGIFVRSLDGVSVPRNESNLVVRTIKQLYTYVGRPFKGVQIDQISPIPLSRGLGSSSACIVGGILAANHLLGEPLGTGELLDFAAQMEGHPDNVAPALLGGFVTAVIEDGHVYAIKQELGDDLDFVVAVPDIKLSTDLARSVLPGGVSREDAVFNLSRAALMSAALQGGRYDLLRVATGDRLHQPYRIELIPGGSDMMRFMLEEGAYCSFISGAGSCIMAIAPAADSSFAGRLRERANLPLYSGWRIETYKADNTGATIEY